MFMLQTFNWKNMFKKQYLRMPFLLFEFNLEKILFKHKKIHNC